MFLGPIKALYSPKFYIEYIEKSGFKAALFTLYVFLFSCIFISAVTFFTGKVMAVSMLEKIASYTPEIVIKDGVATVNDDQPLTIEPKELNGYNIVFDTGRTEPVYPTEMAKTNTLLLVTAHDVYFNMNENHQTVSVPEKANIVINQDIINQNKYFVASIIMYSVVLILLIAQVIKLPFMILLGFVVAALINAFTHATISMGKLFKLSCYMQAPVTALFLLNFISPVKIPLLGLTYIVIFAVLSHLVIAHHAPSEQKQEIEEEPQEEQEAEEDVKPTDEQDPEEEINDFENKE